MPYEEPIND